MKKYINQNYSWIILILTVCIGIENAIINFTFAPITKTMQLTYSVTNFEIYYYSMCYSIYYLIMNFPANYIIDHIGVRYSVLIFVTCQAIGSSIRLLINTNINYVILGQTIGALGAPFGGNVNSKVSVKWFSADKRMITTSIMTASFMIGTSSVFYISTLFFNDSENFDINEQKTHTYNYLITTFFISCIVLCLVFLFYREDPEEKMLISEIPRERFSEAIKLLLKNKNFLLLCLAFSVLLSNYGIFVTYMHYLFSPYDFNETEIAYMGTIANLFSFLGKLVAGFFIGRKIAYKKGILIVIGFMIVGTIGLLLFLNLHIHFMVYFFLIIYGFFQQMYWGPSLEFCCELIFPIGEANANGNLIMSGCFVNIILGLVFSKVYNLNKNYWGNISFSYFTLTSLIAFFCFWKINDILKREGVEIELIKMNKELEINQYECSNMIQKK